MTGLPLIVLQSLAAGGARANVLASVICALVIEGAELGALETREVIDGGSKRTIQTLPREWLERLGRAIELGVFEKVTPRTMRKVIDRILAPPLPQPCLPPES